MSKTETTPETPDTRPWPLRVAWDIAEIFGQDWPQPKVYIVALGAGPSSVIIAKEVDLTIARQIVEDHNARI